MRSLHLTDDQVEIEEPGSYSLPADRAKPLVIRSNDIHLDLAGHRIAGCGDLNTQEAGIYITHGCTRVTVTNGTVTGFMYGVLADDGAQGLRCSGISVSRMTCLDNTFRGIMLYARDSSIENCIVGRIGGTALYPDAYAIGIEVRDNHSRVRQNSVFEVYGSGTGESVGISLSDEHMNECLVESNVVVNTRLPESGRSFGIWCRSAAALINNTLVNMTYGIAPPGPRRAQNTIGNVFIGEQCTTGFFSIKDRGTDTLVIPTGQPECLDCLEKAKLNIDSSDVISLVRLASLLYEVGQPISALEYYRQAALLGSSEAARWVAKLEGLASRIGCNPK
jgi:nitrous oxidase accessory protein NosD